MAMLTLTNRELEEDSWSNLRCSKTSGFVHQHLAPSVEIDTKNYVGSLSFFHLHRESAKSAKSTLQNLQKPRTSLGFCRKPPPQKPKAKAHQKEKATTLATCIPFVSGISKKPTPECCENTKKLKANKPKCLCVLIKESTEPSMGLPVNTTLVLQMPSTCDVDGKIFDCLSILNLAPNSPDAKFFKEADSNSSTSPTSNGHESPPTSASATAASSSTSDLSSNCMGWFRCWFSDTLRSSNSSSPSKSPGPAFSRSEFNKKASQIGMEIQKTSQKIARLAQLAKMSSMFNDPTMEIQELTALVKNDITTLNVALTNLQTIQNMEITDGNYSQDKAQGSLYLQMQWMLSESARAGVKASSDWVMDIMGKWTR
ncbi:hypothetical protein TB1_020515 [Malus domestica]